MAFKFKLQKLLEYKETIEGLKKTEYGDAIYRLGLEEEKLMSLNEEKREVMEKKEANGKVTSIAELKMYSEYLKILSIKIGEQKQLVKQREEERDRAQDELLFAMQEKKAFEKLKEKEYKKYIMEEKKKEEKVVDQIVTYKTSTQ